MLYCFLPRMMSFSNQKKDLKRRNLKTITHHRTPQNPKKKPLHNNNQNLNPSKTPLKPQKNKKKRRRRSKKKNNHNPQESRRNSDRRTYSLSWFPMILISPCGITWMIRVWSRESSQAKRWTNGTKRASSTRRWWLPMRSQTPWRTLYRWLFMRTILGFSCSWSLRDSTVHQVRLSYLRQIRRSRRRKRRMRRLKRRMR